MERMPSSPRPRTVKPKSNQPSYVMTAHSLRRQAMSQGTQQWGFDLTWPPMTREEFAPLWAHFLAHKGRAGAFEYVPHTLAKPVGVGAGGGDQATENLVKWSQRLDLAPWQYSSGTTILLAGTTDAIDGTSGQLWTVDSADTTDWPNINQELGNLSGQVVASIYLKAGTAGSSCLLIQDTASGTTHRVRVSWSGGVPSVADTLNVENFGLLSVGDGWYRLWFAVDLHARNQEGHPYRLYLYPRVFEPGVTAGTFIWGAQIDTGDLTPNAYLRTWSAVREREAGPRAVLKQNSVAYSVDFSSPYWDKTCCTAPAVGPEIKGYTTAPDGSMAQSWGTPADNGIYAGCLRVAGIVPAASTSQYVASCYVKRDQADKFRINIFDASTSESYQVGVTFDSAGVAALTNSWPNDGVGLEAVGDGWYRVWVALDTADRGLTSHSLSLYLYPHAEDDGDPLAPEGTYIWGVQFESGRVTPGPFLKRLSAADPSYLLPEGSEIWTEGWPASVEGALKAGDFVKFSGHDKIYMAIKDVDTDAAGNALLVVEPQLHETVSPDETIQLEDLPFRVASASDLVESLTDVNGHYTYSVTLWEAL